jgi:hypothetical protein
MRIKYLLVSAFVLFSVVLVACGGQLTPPANIPGAVNTAAGAAGTLAASTAVQTAAVGAVSTLAASTAVETIAAGAVTTLEASTAVQAAAVQDLNGLMAALQAAGMTVESAGAVSQPLFSVPGQGIKVNGQEVQVYVFDTPEAMEAAAAQVTPDGSSIGTTMPTWTSDPHFYKGDRLLIVYVGQDQKVLDILSGTFGPQFAGR